MNPPVVVQGQAVHPQLPPQQPQPNKNAHLPGAATGNGCGCKDPFFALLFCANIVGISYVAFSSGLPELMGEEGSPFADYEGYIYNAILSGFLSLLFAALGLSIFMQIPETIIKVTLLSVLIVSAAGALIAIKSDFIFVGIIGIVIFALGVCYVCAVWSRIPFAAVNMETTAVAIKANIGVTFFAYFFTILAECWTMIWALAFLGVAFLGTTTNTTDAPVACDDDYAPCPTTTNTTAVSEGNNWKICLVVLSYFLTHQVIQNSVHVTVAGVVKAWWSKPAGNGSCCQSCCGSDVTGAFIRTITTSFGSICLGSLIVAFVRVLEKLASLAPINSNNDGGTGACIVRCILWCVAGIPLCILACWPELIEYFNQWAFIYVGVKGMGYTEAGKSVFELFQRRGEAWDRVIADGLVGHVLFLVSLIVGGVVGGLAYIFVEYTDWFDNAGGGEEAVVYTNAFGIGFAMCSILLTTIGSGVNAVIVLFAEAPADLQSNHQAIGAKMNQIWEETYQGSTI